MSEARQASYLTTSYRMAARYRQVQLLTWFPTSDDSPDGTYPVRVRPQRSATWKVRWRGVATSPGAWVRVD